MPPWEFTQAKYAAAACAEPLKSAGPVLPTIAPISIGWPVAALPLLRPHFGASAAETGAIASVDASPATAKASNTVIVRCIESSPPFFVRAFLRKHDLRVLRARRASNIITG